jgi:hypothetical protein
MLCHEFIQALVLDCRCNVHQPNKWGSNAISSVKELQLCDDPGLKNHMASEPSTVDETMDSALCVWCNKKNYEQLLQTTVCGKIEQMSLLTAICIIIECSVTVFNSLKSSKMAHFVFTRECNKEDYLSQQPVVPVYYSVMIVIIAIVIWCGAKPECAISKKNQSVPSQMTTVYYIHTLVPKSSVDLHLSHRQVLRCAKDVSSKKHGTGLSENRQVPNVEHALENPESSHAPGLLYHGHSYEA